MRSKIEIIVFSIIMCSTLITCVFSEIVQAEPAKLQIVDEPTYYLYRVESHPSKYYYLINVTFYNSGDEDSVPVDIKIFEEGRPAISPDEYQGVSFKAGEYKNLTFDWGTALAVRTIEIRYAPSHPNDPATEYNSGSKTIEIASDSTEENNTPGFEFTLIILTLSIISYLKRFKTKKKN